MLGGGVWVRVRCLGLRIMFSEVDEEGRWVTKFEASEDECLMFRVREDSGKLRQRRKEQ